MLYVTQKPPRSALPVVGTDDWCPVRRVYCVGRNYAAHAREMGHDPNREPPFFFIKPADALLPVPAGETAELPYPPKTALSPMRFPCSPEWWRGDEALQAEAQAPQAPREQGDQAAGNVRALRPRSLFSAGVRSATTPNRRVPPPKKSPKDSPSGSRSSRSVRVIWLS